MEEIWKEIPEDSDYRVSNLGRVESRKKNKVTILKPHIVEGYQAVYIRNKETGKQQWRYVHRLVAQAFIPNPNNLEMVNHKDENKINNVATNLEWSSARRNTNWGTTQERIYDTKVAKGIIEDLRGMSEEERKVRHKAKYYKYKQTKPHTIYQYKLSDDYRYELVGVWKNSVELAKAVKSTPNTMYKRAKNQEILPDGYMYSFEKIREEDICQEKN